MADILTHVLVAYVIATLLSWRYEWITYPFITLVMLGAMLPDLSRLELLFPAATIEATLGLPWSWTPLHRVGGTALVVYLGALLAPKRHQRAVFVLVAVGAASHYALDLLLYRPSGLTTPFFWPFTTHHFAFDGFYLSTDRWPAAAASIIAAVVWYADHRRDGSPSARASTSNTTGDE